MKYWPHLYLSWTFCLISTRFSAEMSLSRYSERCSVADSRSRWLSYTQGGSFLHQRVLLTPSSAVLCIRNFFFFSDQDPTF